MKESETPEWMKVIQKKWEENHAIFMEELIREWDEKYRQYCEE